MLKPILEFSASVPTNSDVKVVCHISYGGYWPNWETLIARFIVLKRTFVLRQAFSDGCDFTDLRHDSLAENFKKTGEGPG